MRECGKFCFVFFITCATSFAYADILPLDDALRATYTSCIGIDNELADLKKMAGINTAVTAVGTGLGAGAAIVGIQKEKTDKRADQIKLDKLERIARYRLEHNIKDPSDEEIAQFIANMTLSSENNTNVDTELSRLDKKSKKLGNWRTGLLAGNTVTNVAGAIISGTNRVDGDLQAQIDNCRKSLKNLQSAIMQAKLNGADITEAQNIYNTCKEYDYVDISKINKRGKGATISSVIGATTGLSGTITSGVANSNSVRNQGVGGTRTNKEKNLNAASNVLAGASTVASATATVFNASQIKAIKDVANVASKCSGVLK